MRQTGDPEKFDPKLLICEQAWEGNGYWYWPGC